MPQEIRTGDRGAAVVRWQFTLIALGYDPKGTDGSFGRNTARATREFQRDHGLGQDAQVGSKSWGAAEVAIGQPRVVRRGDTGADVARWQRLVAAHGHDPNGIDGTFGTGSERATKSFQTACGMVDDGIVTAPVWSAALGTVVTTGPEPTPAPIPATPTVSAPPPGKPPPDTPPVVAPPPVTPPPVAPPVVDDGRPLKDRIDLSVVALAPATPVAGRDAGVIRTWNRYGGVLTELSRQLGLDADAAAAVLAIESGGTGMTKSGPTIRFENHVFFDRWGTSHPSFHDHFQYDSTKRWRGHRWRRAVGGTWQLCHRDGQPGEWEVFRFAAGFDNDAAITSMSIGLAQIMGFHHRRIGYESPQAMLDAFGTGEAAQILGFFDFVTTSSGNRLVNAIRDLDWYTFAKGYNGSGKFRDYGDKMKAAFDQLRAAK